MSIWVFAGLAIFGGAALALQPSINATLGQQLGHPVRAAAVSFSVGCACLWMVALVSRVGWPSWQQVTQTSWWAWCGGLLGMVVVTASLLAVPKLGAARLFAIMVTTQLVLAILFDHFGWFGLTRRPVNLVRIIGVGLLVIGVLLVTLTKNDRSQIESDAGDRSATRE